METTAFSELELESVVWPPSTIYVDFFFLDWPELLLLLGFNA